MSEDIKTETVKCPKCGTKTIISRYKQNFCSNCGMELDYTTLKKKKRENLYKIGNHLYNFNWIRIIDACSLS